MVKKLILSFSLFITGCGGFYSPINTYIDPEFNIYIDQYKLDKSMFLGTTQIKQMSITFKVLNLKSGLCSIRSFKNILTNKTFITYYNIYIDPNIWKIFTDTEKKILIYHELGHCDLGLDHSIENTIMNPYTMDQTLFNNNLVYYLNLLFIDGK